MRSEGQTLLLLGTSLVRAGAETQMVRLACELRRRGWDVRVVSMLQPEAFTRELNRSDVPWTSLDMPRGLPDPRGLIDVVELLRRWRPQALATFMFHANILGRVAGRIAKMPLVVSSIRTENFGGRHRDLAMRATDRWSRATVVNSRLAARSVVERNVASAEKVQVIPNAIPADDYVRSEDARFRTRRDLEVQKGSFLWLSIGRLEDQKDFPTLLRAWADVRIRRPDAELRVAGEGPRRARLESLAASLGLAGSVRFLGLRDDVPELLAAADGFVMSSRTEGMPNAVMEAMAAGVPVVGTRVGGIPDLVEHGETGRLAPAGAPSSLGAEMLQIMETPEERRRAMGRRGAVIVRASYGVASVVDRWEALFRELGSSKPTPRMPSRGVRKPEEPSR